MADATTESEKVFRSTCYTSKASWAGRVSSDHSINEHQSTIPLSVPQMFTGVGVVGLHLWKSYTSSLVSHIDQKMVTLAPVHTVCILSHPHLLWGQLYQSYQWGSPLTTGTAPASTSEVQAGWYSKHWRSLQCFQASPAGSEFGAGRRWWHHPPRF